MLDKLVIADVNGIRAVVARPGDSARELAQAGDISVADFIKYNDLKPGDALKPGQVYYLKRKKKKATVYRHVVAEGESLWDVSQRYGLRMDKLLQKNRMKRYEEVKPGQVLWLRYIRPAKEPVAFEPVPNRKADAGTKSEAQPTPQAPQQQVLKAQLVEPEPKSGRAQGASENKAQPVARQQEATRPQVVTTQATAVTKESPRVDAMDTGSRKAESRPAEPRQAESRQAGPRQAASYPEEKPQVVSSADDAVKEEAMQTISFKDEPMVVDTPVTKPAPKKPLQQKTNQDVVTSPQEDFHLYPEENNGKRNVSTEKQENSMRRTSCPMLSTASSLS